MTNKKKKNLPQGPDPHIINNIESLIEYIRFLTKENHFVSHYNNNSWAEKIQRKKLAIAILLEEKRQKLQYILTNGTGSQ